MLVRKGMRTPLGVSVKNGSMSGGSDLVPSSRKATSVAFPLTPELMSPRTLTG